MASFYADEQFPKATTIALRSLGHDVLTVQEAGNANQKIPDEDVLAFATDKDRAVLTLNRYDFICTIICIFYCNKLNIYLSCQLSRV